MTRATGPPPGMTEKRTELTPMLRQYLELCEDHEDAIVLFQVGDFYEAFCEAAEEVARVCEVTLTKREDSTGSYPMAGLPIDNAASYLERLLEADYRVAIADQVEDAAEASGLVDRAVTRVVTPGTLVDDELLSGSANYVACVAGDGGGGGDGDDETMDGDDERGSQDGPFGLAAVDVSTGECFVTSGDRARIAEELDRIAPSELLCGPDVPSFTPADAGAAWMETVHEPAFEAGAPRETLADYLAVPDRRLANEAEVRACGAALAYAEYTQGDDGTLEYVSRVRRYDARDHLRLDAAVLRSLELFENVGPGAGDTVFDVLDETNCALGRRTLSRWLRRPLVDRGRIESRLDGVEELAADSLVREAVREELSTAYDVERLVGRVSRGRANARELRSLHATLAAVPSLRAALDPDCEHLRGLRERLDELAAVRDLIDRAIAVDPPQELTEGGVVREGFDEELDDLRATEREGREWVADLEAAERERTGIDSLSVGHNQVHGYYIEVTKANLDRVPDDYTRRQTLKNSERFYTPDLKRREDEILGASERADKLEYELFTEVRARVAEETDRLQALAEALGELDALCSLATVAVERDYVRPSFRAADESGGIEIEGGRHPVVEATQSEFVPNDADLPAGSVAVITGPNMSGKSTYMRQVALCVVLAQMGSFVPAEAARLPVVDRVFTRVGASDDIAGGQSTFMREMSELTEILHDATEESLVLLDEVGRGTSTADGLAIARATTEFIHDRLGATTLFATHYHDLTGLAEQRERVFNLHFAATREGDGAGSAGRNGRDAGGAVTFLHRVARGASSSSYGVEVARMAGVPEAVVERSRELVVEGEADRPESRGSNASLTDYATTPEESLAGAGGGGRTDADADADAVVEELRSLDVATVTPLEALNTLHDLRRRLDSDDE